VTGMVMTLLSLSALSMVGAYHYVLADWQLAYRAVGSAENRDQCRAAQFPLRPRADFGGRGVRESGDSGTASDCGLSAN
jgi:hypothetical protein